MARTARFEIRPVPSSLALEWIDNSRRIVRQARHNRHFLSVELQVHTLELLETLLGLWKQAALERDEFTWAADVDDVRLVALAHEWQALASMTPLDLEALGCEWAPARTNVVFDAVLEGLAEALASMPETEGLGRALRKEPPGS